jgi:hypothetical protein
MSVKLLVVGSRSIHDPKIVSTIIDEFVARHNLTVDTLINGGAQGVDTYAERWAVVRDIPVAKYLPQYDKYIGREAPLKRNEEMARVADTCLIIWDGHSSGSMHMAACMRKASKPVEIIEPSKIQKK